MRISYLHYVYANDTSIQHVMQFAEAARSLGHELSVHRMNLASGDVFAGGGESSSARLRRMLSPYLHDPRELLRNVPYAARATAIVRREQPDVLLVRSTRLLCAEVVASRITDTPLVLEVNAPACEQSGYREIPGLAAALERYDLRAADAIVVVSPTLARHFVERHRIAESKIVVSPNGADCEMFRPDLDASDLRRQYELGDRTVVGFLGSFHAWHGLELLRALVGSLSTEADFLLLGAGPEWQRFRASLARDGLGDAVKLPGAIPHGEVPPHLRLFDVALVVDLAFYMSPLKLFEYMASGCATVVPRHPALDGIVEDEREVLMFERGNVEDLVRTVRRLLADPALRAELGRRARERVASSYTWRDNAARVLGACEQARQTFAQKKARMQ